MEHKVNMLQVTSSHETWEQARYATYELWWSGALQPCFKAPLRLAKDVSASRPEKAGTRLPFGIGREFTGTRQTTAAGASMSMSVAVAMHRVIFRLSGDLFLHARSDRQLGLGLGFDLIDRDAVGQLDQRHAAVARLVDGEDTEL